MKNFTFLLTTLFVTTFCWQANAQFGCGSGIPIADGFTQMGITTPGVGGPEDWNTNPSGTSINSSYWDDDVYLFEYTAGVNNENISMTIDSRNSWFGIGIFDNCTGTAFDTELDANGSTTSGVLTVSAAIAPGNTVYIAVGQWGTPNDLDFDVTDFTVNQVSCPDPSLLTATNISGSSADLAWTENGTATVWDIEYGVAPYTPTGTPTASGVANPYNSSALTPNTTYEFYVRADCGGTSGTSSWAGPYSFTTYGDCASSGSYDYLTNSTMASSLQSFIANTPGDYITLTFSAGTTESCCDDWFIMDAADGTGNVIASGAGSIVGSYESTTGEISFYVESDGSVNGTTFVYGLACSPPPSCATPSAGTAANITSSSADLAWTENGTATVWDIEYGVAPYTPTGTPTASGVANPYNSSALTPNTTYEFYVRADCGGTSGTSSWAGPYSFTTYGDCASSGSYDYLTNSTMASSLQSFIANTPGDYITLTFSAGTTESCCDDWFIMDAADGTGNVIASGAGSIVGSYESTTGEISFYVESDGSVNGTTFVYGLACSPPPSCPDPSAGTATNITSSSADLTWTENGTATSWEVEWGIAAFTPGSGTAVITGTNPHALTGLAANSSYDFYVRAICGVGDTSAWAGPTSFTTLCPAAFTPAYLEDFTTFVPGCWDEAIDGSPLTGPTGAGSGEWGHTDYLNNGVANDAAKINLYNTGTSDWLLSPNFDMSAGGPWELVINAGVTTYNGTGGLPMGSDDSVQVVISTDGGLTWGAIYTWDVNNTPSNTGEPYAIDLAAYTGAANLFGIWASEGVVDDTEDYDFHINDFEIRVPPLCIEPNGLTASNITTTSADLAWTENGTATSWEVEYDSTGFVQGTGSIVVTGTNPHALTGLTANYSYDFYVRAICGVGDSSAWAGPYSFVTPCNTAAITYTQDFTTWPMQCWDLTGGSQSWSDNGSGIALANFWSWPNQTDAIMSTEPIDISVDARVRFDWSHLYSATYPLDSLSVDVKVLPGGTWTSIWGKGGSDLESNDGAGNTTPGSMVTETILLDPATYTGQDVQVRFVATSGYGPDLFVDNLIIEPVPACIDPSGLTASNITTVSADLGWTENGTATSWEVEYDSTGFVQGTGTTVVTGTNPHALTGLTANYSYDFYVRAICGVGDSSAWAGPYSFVTPCNTAAITYTQDFTTWPMQCWDLTGGSQSWSDNGSGIALANFWSWPNQTDAIMSTEPIDISVDARVRFDWSHLYSATYPLDSLSVDVKVLPGGTWTSIWGKGGSDLESNDGAGNTTPGSMVTETILLDPATYTGQDVQVRFVATSGWGPDLFVDNLIIDALPTCSVDLGADVTLCSGQDSVTLDAGAGPYTYEWTTLETTQTIVVSSSTADTVEYSVLITDTISMCQAIDTVSVTFDDCSTISELTGSNVSIYPNPSNGNFIVSLSNISEQVSVQVVDMQGRLIYSQIEGLKVGKENVISLENVERGVYLISVSSNKGRYTQSIVIE